MKHSARRYTAEVRTLYKWRCESLESYLMKYCWNICHIPEYSTHCCKRDLIIVYAELLFSQ
jgi:hypothetical protein